MLSRYEAGSGLDTRRFFARIGGPTITGGVAAPGMPFLFLLTSLRPVSATQILIFLVALIFDGLRLLWMMFKTSIRSGLIR